MKNESKRTKQCKKITIIFTILHFLFVFGPLFFFVPYGFATGIAVQKVTLAFSVIVSLILAVMSLLQDASKRGGLAKTIMWILVLGISVCLEQVKPFIIVMAIMAIIDEVVLVKVKNHWASKLSTNKEIDLRR